LAQSDLKALPGLTAKTDQQESTALMVQLAWQDSTVQPARWGLRVRKVNLE
jgi:hypothetical protein